MRALLPCDLGDGIEVLHEVESVEVEMECDVEVDHVVAAPVVEAPPDDDAVLADDTVRTPKVWFDVNEDIASTTQFARTDDLGTHQFDRYSAPYERIEIQLDANAFLRATIEEARTTPRAKRPRQ